MQTTAARLAAEAMGVFVLVFAGCGAGLARNRGQRIIPLFAGLAAASLFTVATVLKLQSEAILALAFWQRALTATLLIALPSFFMGPLLPLGLKRLSQAAPGLTPWAWAINASTSVLGSITATILAVLSGYTAALVTAALLYVLAALVYRRPA